MDDKALQELIRKRFAAPADQQIAELIEQAQSEALAELKTTLRELMHISLLEHVVRYLQADERPVAAAQAPDAAKEAAPAAKTISLPAATEQQRSDKQAQAEPATAPRQAETEQAELLQEIEAIRKQLAENERRLAQPQAAPLPTDEAQPETEAAAEAAAGAADEHGLGYYVYAITKEARADAVQDLPAMEPPYPAYLLACGPLQAVVSQVPLEEYGQVQLEHHLEDMVWVEARVRAYQDALVALLENRTIVPMKFCTIYRSEERVQAMVREFQEAFMEALERLEGKQEWSLKIYCAPDVLAKKLAQNADAVPNEATNRSAGAAYFMRKKRADAVAEEMGQFCNQAAQESHDQLVLHAQEAVLLSLPKQETLEAQKLIFNGAYLVDRGQLEAFQATIDGLSARYEDYGLSYEWIGPWPPFNFVTIGDQEDLLNG